MSIFLENLTNHLLKQSTMKLIILWYCICAGLVPVHTREEVTVAPDTGGSGSGLDLTKTDLTTVYCEAQGKECVGDNLVPAKYSATVRQCHIDCSYNLKCLDVFYTKDKMCHHRAKRCTSSELRANTKGADYYRLKKGESCPSDRPVYVPTKIKMSNTFCVLKNKECKGRDIYDKPQNIQPLQKCLEKCARIATCYSVDFVDSKCSPKEYNCTDDELVTNPNSVNALRLSEEEKSCSPTRSLACGDNSHAEGTRCVCNDGWKMVDGNCEQGIPPTTPKPVTTPAPKTDPILLPLTNVCPKVVTHEYCPAPGDCNSADHIIRQVVGLPGEAGCKRACDEECSCKAFRLYKPNGDCYLSTTPCSSVENPDPNWQFYVKAAPGQSCDDAKFGCRKQDTAYCLRAGDCLGFNIRHIPTPRDSCQSLCTQECACKAFFHDGVLNCWMKSIACTTRSHANTAYQYYVKTVKGVSCDWAIGGRCYDIKFKYCRRNGDCLGHNIRAVAAGLDDCKRECDRECACQSFWKDAGLGCVLKSFACTKLSHQAPAVQYYVKIGPNESCPEGYGEEERPAFS